MADLVQEVGARLILKGQKEFLAATAAVKKEIGSVGKTTEATNAKIIASERAVADARAASAVKMAEAAALREKSAAATVRAVELQAAGETEAATAARAEAAELTRAARASEAQATAARASARASAEQATAIRASARASEVSAASTTRMTRAFTGLAGIGKTAMLGIAVTGAVVGTASVRMAGNFEQAMTMVQNMAGVSHDRIGALSEGLLNMAPGVVAGPVALADALYRIASASAGLGATNKQLLDMTQAAAQLNLIGGGNDESLGETARVLGGVRASDIKGVGGYKGIVSLAAATVGSGDMKMHDFVEALGTGVLPAAANAGIKLPEIGALLSVLTDNLIPGSTAGHVMSHMFSLMGAPSGVAAKAFGAIGLHPTDLGYEMRNKGLLPALGTLKERLAAPQTGAAVGGAANEKALLGKFGFTPAQTKQIMTVGADKTEQMLFLTKAFGGAKQSVPIVTALQEYDRLKARSAHITAQSQPDQAQKAIDAAKATWNNRVKALHVSMQVLEVRLGEKLIPILMKVADTISKVVHWFEKHKTTALALGAAVGTVLVIAMGMYIAAAIAATLATLGMTWPVLAVIAVIALLAAGFVALWRTSETFRDIVITAFQMVGTAVLTQVRAMLEVVRLFAWVSDHLFGTHFGATIDKAIGGIDKLQNKLDHIKDPKPVKVDIMTRIVGDANPWNAVQFPASTAKRLGGAGDWAPSKPAPTLPVGGRYRQNAGMRAYGGAVQMLRSYVVGEDGPEVFTAPVSGHITPHAQARTMGAFDAGDSGSSSAAGGRVQVIVQPGAIVIHESHDPQKTFEATKQGIADAVARM
ncbi:MAG: hypothetical protein JWM02_3508 [Frankiales bacterium]|nr:hypothetical protein [Frankiales bacterium]